MRLCHKPNVLIVPIDRLNESGLLRLRRFHRRASLLPFAETAFDVRDRLQSHLMRGLRRECGAPAAGTEEHEFLVLGELRLVVGARRIDPELQHAARAREGARHLALPLPLARIAQVDERDIVASVKLARILYAERLDLALGPVYHLAEAFSDRLRHRPCLLSDRYMVL